MTAKSCDTEKRERIMDAARELILHYGYKKTTMQDIAEKAGISVGAIYNFFENKDAITVACGKKIKEHLLESLREIKESELAPEAKLREMMFRSGLGCHDHFKDTPHGLEIVTALEHMREELNEEFDAKELALVAEVLEEGVAKGDFSVEEPIETARTFISAFASFRPPTCLRFTEEETKREIIKMVEMLLPAIRSNK
jgi:AcrR family transcriptional regulator